MRKRILGLARTILYGGIILASFVHRAYTLEQENIPHSETILSENHRSASDDSIYREVGKIADRNGNGDGETSYEEWKKVYDYLGLPFNKDSNPRENFNRERFGEFLKDYNISKGRPVVTV